MYVSYNPSSFPVAQTISSYRLTVDALLFVRRPSAVWPPNRRAEILDYLSTPTSLSDLSISRPRKRLQWGIPVPGDEEEHTMYVWIEALVNYLTSAGYPWLNAKGEVDVEEGRRRGWPTDVHVVGKDITRCVPRSFCSIYVLLMIRSLVNCAGFILSSSQLFFCPLVSLFPAQSWFMAIGRWIVSKCRKAEATLRIRSTR